jgi:hypothetical protein
MSDIIGIDPALNQAIIEGQLYDPFVKARGIVGIMLGMDALYSKSGQGQEMSGPAGGLNKARVKFSSEVKGKGKEWQAAGRPTPARGVNARTGAISELATPVQETAPTYGHSQPYTYIETPVVGIRKTEINRLANYPGDVADVTGNILNQVAKGLVDCVQEMIWPGYSTGTYTTAANNTLGAAAENKLQAFNWALSNGQTNNEDAVAATSRVYCGVEIGTANRELRPLAYGVEGTPVAFTLKKFRLNMIRPLRRQTDVIDIAFVDPDLYATLQELMENKLMYGITEEIGWGITAINIDGIRFIEEMGLENGSGTRQMIVGDSSSLEFHMDALDSASFASANFTMKDPPDSVWYKTCQAAATAMFVNKYPSKWGIWNSLST